MPNKLSPATWRDIADRLRETNNFTPSTGVDVNLSIGPNGDGRIDIMPSSENHSAQLCCMEDVVDVCRGFGLSFYVVPVPSESHIEHVPCVHIY